MSEANKTQVGGSHYHKAQIQHWDFAASQNFDYFQGQVTKYVTRWKEKNGLQDLEKAMHFLQKYIEVEKSKALPKAVDIDLNKAMDHLRQQPHNRTEHPAPFGYAGWND